MKQVYIILCLIMACFPAVSQLSSGGFHASFGVDGDIKAGYLKYGPLTGSIYSDDWFSTSSASGSSVIDTTNASYYRSLLQSSANISFSKRMPVPLYSNMNGKIWLDAIYTRDFIVQSTSNDSTAFTGGAKNGDDPSSWGGGAALIPDKTDLVDVFAHMRRNGINVQDSLWFFTGATTIGTSGSRYFDIELYKNHISYNATTGNFTSGGPDAGHTQWMFDASGNITQTGDMIVAVNYSPGSTPVVDVRIWISNTTYTTVTPVLFNFGGSFNGATTSFGYASIVSKTGTTTFGSGIANYSATPAADTTYATPWGSNGVVSGSQQWVTQYNSLQFVEAGLNLTRIGLDPALYTTLGSSACESSFASIFFKSRSSNSFTSNLQDFVGPLDFLQQPVLDYSLQQSTLSCNQPTGPITVLNNTTAGYYTWNTPDGTITSANNDSIVVSEAGTYIVEAAVAQGCPVRRTDTVTITADIYTPSASFYVTSSPDPQELYFHGGDTAASNYSTPFGGSQGLLWSWSGPNGFSSTLQNPVNGHDWGEYRLIVTEQRNGCTDTAWDYISYTILSPGSFPLQARYVNRSVLLKWSSISGSDITSFEIERSSDGNRFYKTGTVQAGQSNLITSFSFTDTEPPAGAIQYRVKAIGRNMQSIYSNLVKIDTYGKPLYSIRNSNPGIVHLVADMPAQSKGKVAVYNASGRLLYVKNIVLYKGYNNIELGSGDIQSHGPHSVSLFINDKPVLSEVVLF